MIDEQILKITYHKFFVAFFLFMEHRRILGVTNLTLPDGREFSIEEYDKKYKISVACMDELYKNIKQPLAKYENQATEYFDMFTEYELDYLYVELYIALASVFSRYFRLLPHGSKHERTNHKVWSSAISEYIKYLPKSDNHKDIILKIEKFLVTTLPEDKFKN